MGERALHLTAILLVAIGCRQELPAPDRDRLSADALRFARHLMARDYAAAHAMTTADYRARVSIDSLGRAFEFSVPRSMSPVDSLFVQMTDTMAGWAVRQPGDVGWIYVVIPADSTRDGEAVSLIFAREAEGIRIRDVEIGRP